jgi:hypothetical protein
MKDPRFKEVKIFKLEKGDKIIYTEYDRIFYPIHNLIEYVLDKTDNMYNKSVFYKGFFVRGAIEDLHELIERFDYYDALDSELLRAIKHPDIDFSIIDRYK